MNWGAYVAQIFTAFLMLIPVSSLFANSLIDPTQPQEYIESREDTANDLTAIIFSPARKIAIMHDQIVKVGDVIEGEKVVSITRNSVKLESANGIRVIMLEDQSVKRFLP